MLCRRARRRIKRRFRLPAGLQAKGKDFRLIRETGQRGLRQMQIGILLPDDRAEEAANRRLMPCAALNQILRQTDSPANIADGLRPQAGAYQSGSRRCQAL